MIERYFDELIKMAKERKEYFENCMHYARLVKEAVKGEVIVLALLSKASIRWHRT